MKKPGKCCFLVKKKRPRGVGVPKEALLAPKENRKLKEIFKIKSENIPDSPLKEVLIRNNKKNEGYKILECEDQKIILTKLKKENKINREGVIDLGIKEKQKNKKYDKVEHSAASMESMLDYDLFLEVFNKQDGSPEEVAPLDESNTSSTHILIELEDKRETPRSDICEKKPSLKVNKIRNIQKIEKNNLKRCKIEALSGKIQKKLQLKQPRRKKSKSREDIYNINNFIIHPNQIKITHKASIKNIVTPEFKVAPGYHPNLDNISVTSFSSVEDISEEVYSKYHDQYERREREWREQIFGDPEKKKKEVPKNVNDNTRTDISDGNFKIRIDLDNI